MTRLSSSLMEVSQDLQEKSLKRDPITIIVIILFRVTYYFLSTGISEKWLIRASMKRELLSMRETKTRIISHDPTVFPTTLYNKMY